jgi:sugar O-acyltransferase (sialic acid O-acetyltransferase NeuD family)
MTRVGKVVIIGAGDHGRGTLEIFREAGRHNGAPRVLGFLDDAPHKQGIDIAGATVLGGLDWIEAHGGPEIGYIIGIADTRVKQRIACCLATKQLTFVPAIHPSVIVASGVSIAPGAIINAGVAIAYDTVIEAHTTVNLNATVGHDCIVGRFSTVAPGANIAGRVHVGEGSDIGLNATIGKGLRIGEWSVIGPGTVVIKDVAAQQTLFGNPARVVPLSSRSPRGQRVMSESPAGDVEPISPDPNARGHV